MKGKMFTLDSGLRGFWTAGKSHILPLFASVVLIVLGNLISPGFAKLSNIANILTMSSILIIAAIAQLLVVVTGEEGIDLSIGAVMSMGCLLMPTYSRGDNLRFIPVCIALLVIAAVIGLINGLSTQYLKLPPLVMTMIMGIVVNGATFAIVHGQPSVTVPGLLLAVSKPVLGPVRVLLLIALLFAAIFVLFLKKTRLGRSLFLIGCNRPAAELSGISVRRNVVLAYMMASMLAMIAGMFMVGYVGTANIKMAEKYTMLSVASLAVGGTKMSGGRGSITASALGAVVMVVLTNLLVAAGLNTGVQKICEGGILQFVLILLFLNSPKLRQ